MKWRIMGIMTVFFCLFLVSCMKDDDSYSLSDIWIDFGILHEDEGAEMGYYIHLDGGDEIFPVASDVNLGMFADSSRVLVNYTVLGEKQDTSGYLVKINSMQDILMKGIMDITDENEDSIGNDPILVKDAWITGNLLNFELKYWGGYKVHFINLVKQPGALSAASQPVELEIRHNSNGDTEKLPYIAYVSFNLSAIKIPGLDSTRFKVTAKGYNGNSYSDEGVFRYGRN